MRAIPSVKYYHKQAGDAPCTRDSHRTSYVSDRTSPSSYYLSGVMRRSLLNVYDNHDIRSTFRAVDVDHNGKIDKGELVVALQEVLPYHTPLHPAKKKMTQDEYSGLLSGYADRILWQLSSGRGLSKRSLSHRPSPQSSGALAAGDEAPEEKKMAAELEELGETEYNKKADERYAIERKYRGEQILAESQKAAADAAPAIQSVDDLIRTGEESVANVTKNIANAAEQLRTAVIPVPQDDDDVGEQERHAAVSPEITKSQVPADPSDTEKYISLPEFRQATYLIRSLVRERDIQDWFDYFDKNADGVIDMQELRSLFLGQPRHPSISVAEMEQMYSEKSLRQLMRKIGVQDDDKGITLSQFERMCSRLDKIEANKVSIASDPMLSRGRSCTTGRARQGSI